MGIGRRNAFRFKQGSELRAAFHRPNDYRSQKHQNRNLVDAMHHAKVEICGAIWVRLLEHPNEIVSNFTNFEKLPDSAV
jgi:hypothetical protein